jgi:hypothetical protein
MQPIRDVVQVMMLKERFWAKVKKTNGCWIWIAARNVHKYGQFNVEGKMLKAHRVSWVLHFGLIPGTLHVLHKCDNPPCVNPAHLFLGTPADNMRDCVTKGRIATGDRSGARTHPERLATGSRNGNFTHPERRPKGERNGTHTHPDRIASGERNGAYTHPECILRGEQRRGSKLTEHAVREVLELYNQGWLQRELAVRFGVSFQLISQVVNRVIWRHVLSSGATIQEQEAMKEEERV